MGTRWRPDTCGCDAEFTMDAATGVFTTIHRIAPCRVHRGLATPRLQFDAMLADNRLKNHTFDVAKQVRDDLEPEDLTWTLNDDRSLVVVLQRASAAEKVAIRTALAADSRTRTRAVTLV